MESADANHEELARAFAAYRRLRLPRTGDVLDLGEADVELFAEDSHLAGLVENFLTTGRLVDESIRLATGIDSALAHAIALTDDARDRLAAFRHYRSAMRNLATLLAAVSGVPMVDV